MFDFDEIGSCAEKSSRQVPNFDQLRFTLPDSNMPSAVAVDGANEPFAKRLKLSNGDVSRGPARSRIFAPFRVPWL